MRGLPKHPAAGTATLLAGMTAATDLVGNRKC